MHERDEVYIPYLIRNIEAADENLRDVSGRRVGAPSGPSRKPETTLAHLRRLIEYKNKSGYVSSVLAWDDQIHMKLDAGKAK